MVVCEQKERERIKRKKAQRQVGEGSRMPHCIKHETKLQIALVTRTQDHSANQIESFNASLES